MALTSVLSQPLFWVTFGLLALLLLGLAWRLRLRWRPAWALRALLVALVLAGLLKLPGGQSQQQLSKRQVLVVDQSDSLDPAALAGIQQKAQAWQSAGEERLVVAYGATPQALLSPGAPWPVLDGRASDLAGALDLASELLGESPGRILLASDGTASDLAAVRAAIDGLISHGHRLDVLPLELRVEPGDGYVGALSAPSNLWSGTPFDVILPVLSPPSTNVTLSLKINGQDSGLAAENLGEGLYRFQAPPQEEGLVTLEALAEFTSPDGDTDPQPANNQAFATLQVFAAPRVLFVTPQSDSPQLGRFVQLLQEARLEVESLPPSQLPTDLASLERYRVIFLHNLLSNQLSQEQMLSLQVFVSRLAGGVVFLGGRSSFTLGGYRDTVLEPMLPVKLEPPPRSERPPIVFLLILDRSASMGTITDPADPLPIELAREASMRAIEAMQPQDWLGVLTFSQESSWDVPLRELGSGLSLRQALDAVSRVQPTSTTYMYNAMQTALAAMGSLPADAPPARHILVLSDGLSFDGSLPEFAALAQAAQEQGITLSSIAFGEEADEETMAAIAEAGTGRYYSVSQADELPRILVYESQAARSENVQAGQTALRLGEPEHPILFGLKPGDLPSLSGYNALSSRVEQGAEDVLVSASFGDPVLSAWQYGLGRVIAWTGDLGEEWTGQWGPGTEGRFWSQVVRYALVNPALGPAQVSVQVKDTLLVVEAALAGASGEPVNLAQVNFTFADPTGQTRAFEVPQSSPGVYRLAISRPPEGAYRAVLAYSGESGAAQEVPAPFAVNPPAEWLPQDPAAGQANLAGWAQQAGGQVLSAQDPLALFAEPPAPEGTAAGFRWSPLLLALVLLWPLEIAIRRRWLPWT